MAVDRLVALVSVTAVLWVGITDGRHGSAVAGQPDDHRGTSGAAPGYIADRVCGDCHRDVAASYRDVGMHNTFGKLTADNVIEDFDNARFHHEPSDRYYEVTRRGDAFFQRRFQVDGQGRTINVIERKIDWVMGSGNHVRTYLYQAPSGELFQMPVSWYSREGAWGMSPGFDRADHDGFTRPIPRRCVFCHNAYPEVPIGSDRYGQPHVFPKNLPTGIGCQRCHGPGVRHVQAAQDPDATLQQIRSAIVNPGKLAPGLRDDVCNQCHMQATVEFMSLIRKFGRGDYSYRPGQPLADYMSHFDIAQTETDAAPFEINHHVYRLRQSRCYKANPEAMSCLTCHDPHRKLRGRAARDHYRDVCIGCHPGDHADLPGLADGDARDDCVGCHMPQHRPHDIVHVVMTDHLIRRAPPTEDWLALLPETPKRPHVTPEIYGPRSADPGVLDAVYLAVPLARDRRVGAAARLRAALDARQPDAIEPYFDLGLAELDEGRAGAAIESLTTATRLNPRAALAHSYLATAYERVGRIDDALAHHRTAVTLTPRDPYVLYAQGNTLAAGNRLDDAVTRFERALALRPNYAEARLNLAIAYGRKGRWSDAAQQFRAALSVDPSSGAAYRHLGSALVMTGD